MVKHGSCARGRNNLSVHDVCVGGTLFALRYFFAVPVMIWVPRSKSDRLTHEHNIRLSILLQNRLRPVSLIDEISMRSFYVNVRFAIYLQEAVLC